MKYLIFIFCALLVGCASSLRTSPKYLSINNELKIEIPSECMLADENSKAMTCISNNNIFFMGIETGSDFQENILSSKYKKEVDDLYYGTFVKLNLGKNHMDFFHIKDSDIIIMGDDKKSILNFSLDIYNKIRKTKSKSESE